MDIRTATAADWPGIWPIWHAVVAAGETYCWSPDTDQATARSQWMLPEPAQVFVAVEPGPGRERILGTALLKPNQPGLGGHIANAAFMVDPAGHRRGMGRALAVHVLAQARQRGYLGMQFNAVVSTNTGALRLWRSLGFAVVATIPDGFRHARHGLVDLHIMYRQLSGPAPAG